MILVGCTLTTFAMGDPEIWGSWLTNVQTHPDHEVRYIAAIEVDGRGLDPFVPLLRRLGEFGGQAVTFRIDDRDTITSANRLAHITAGRNLLTDIAVDNGAEWLFFMDADTEHPPDALPRLLELDHPLTGCHVPTYCLDGPPARKGLHANAAEAAKWLKMDVRVHMNTAGSCLVRRDLFRLLRWRHDPDAGMTDDPCYHHDARQLGVEWLVRHDCLATHHPQSIGPLEGRPHDLSVAR